MKISKVEFLKSDLFMNSWAAAVQHNKVYSDGVMQNKKDNLIRDIELYVNELSKQYRDNISEDEHIENIKNIKYYIESKYSEILYKNSIKIGTVQKFFNLLLKYYWSCNYIKEPPHCPVDRIVLQTINIKDVNWTKIDSVDEYRNVIERIKENIKGQSLSKWELSAWKRRRITASSL